MPPKVNSRASSTSSYSSTPWKLGSVPKGFWSDKANQRKFFDELAKDIGVQKLDDWYEKLSSELLLKNGGGTLFVKHNSSPSAALMSVYPEHNWKPWKFKSIPARYWEDASNQRKFFDDLGKNIGIEKLDDWYEKLSQNTVVEYGGNSIRRLEKSVFAALMAAYPEHNWIPWKFNWAQRGFWKSKENQRMYFDWLGQQVGVNDLNDWYSVLSNDLLKQHGGRPIFAYNKSLMEALTSCYPEHNWIPWKFNVPQGFWKSIDNQRKFFDWLGKEIGVQKYDDWYSKLSLEAIKKNGGHRLVAFYKGSPIAALQAVYPEHNWEQWKFKNVQKGYWSSREHVSLFLADLSQKLEINTLDDWYRVDYGQLQQFGALSIVTKYKGIYNLLKLQYPNYPWDAKKFMQSRKAQRWLTIALKKIFPGEEVIEDYMHPEAFFINTKRAMQLDVFIPSRSLAFEYQGQQHYQEVGVFSPSRLYQHRDEEKRVLCAANNIKLIEVPYWWNRTQESLQQIIAQYA